MPQHETIEAFNEELVKTGKEPEIAAQKGEEIEPVLSPAEYPMDHNGPLTRKPRAKPASGPEAPGDGGAAPSSAPSLDDLFSSFDSPEPAPPPPDASSDNAVGGSFDDLFDTDLFDAIKPDAAIPPADNDFDLAGDLADLDASMAEGASLEDEAPAPDFDETPEPGDIPSEAEVTDEDSTDIDNFLDNFEARLDDEETDSSPAETIAPSQTGDTGETPGDFDDFAIPDFDEESLEDAGSPAPVDDSAGESMEDFGDLDFSSMDFDAPDDTSPASDLPAEPSPSSDAGTDDFATDAFGADAFSSDDFTDDQDINIPAAEEDLGDFDAPVAETGDLSPPTDDDFGAPMGDMPDFATDLGADFGTDDFPEEFSMGDFEKEFGVVDTIPAEDWKAPVMAAAEEDVEEAAKASAADEARDYQVSAEDFGRITETLGSMPLNLKIATEEVLGNPDKPFKDLKDLTEALIRGESPVTIAPIVSRLSGKKIKIPPGYQKKTGKAFEEERNSFAYLFKTNFLPIFRTVVLVSAAIVLLGWLGYRFVYTPMVANSLYDKGLQAIGNGEYDQGNRFFDQAYTTWPDNDRYVQYAEAFSAKDEYERAHRKFRELLGDIDPRVLPRSLPQDILDYQVKERHVALMNGNLVLRRGANPDHVQGILAFAQFLASRYTPPVGKHETRYAEAVIYLERLITPLPKPDETALELQGDIYLAWANFLDDPSRPSPADRILEGTEFYTADPQEGFEVLTRAKQELDAAAATNATIAARLAAIHEGARLAYARLIEINGRTDYLQSKMLGYFIATGQHQHVAPILKTFLSRDKLTADPKVIAALAGAIIDQANGTIDQAAQSRQLVEKCLESIDPVAARSPYPGLYYQLSRFYRLLRDLDREESILANTRLAFQNHEQSFRSDGKVIKTARPFDRIELTQYIDTLVRSAEVAMARDKNLEAHDFLAEARKRYETALLSRKIAAPNALLGRLYALQADRIYFRDPFALLPPEDLAEALKLYRQAVQSQYGASPLTTRFNRPHQSLPLLWEAYQDLSYKTGYIFYHQALAKTTSPADRIALLQLAAERFQDAQGRVISSNPRLRLALANTLSEIGNYEDAIAQYRILYDQLAMNRASISYFNPRSRAADRELLELIHATNNNIGVTCYRAYRNGGVDANDWLSQAQVYLSQATTLAQNYDRSDETGIPADSVRASYLNMDRVLSSVDRDDLYLIPGIARFLELPTIGQEN